MVQTIYMPMDERERLLLAMAGEPVATAPFESQPAQLTPQFQELQLKEQLLNTLIPLRNIQMQKEIGAIARERQAEIAKEANSLLGESGKQSGKQSGGKFTAISSAKVSPFKHFVYDD